MSDYHDHACRMDCCNRVQYFEERARVQRETADYYRAELAKSHALLGRVVHQASERWDTVNLTEHFPTDNLHGRRSVPDPTGGGR